MAAGLLTGCGNGAGTNETSQPAQGFGTSQADAAGDSAQESGAEGTDTEDGGQDYRPPARHFPEGITVNPDGLQYIFFRKPFL